MPLRIWTFSVWRGCIWQSTKSHVVWILLYNGWTHLPCIWGTIMRVHITWNTICCSKQLSDLKDLEKKRSSKSHIKAHKWQNGVPLTRARGPHWWSDDQIANQWLEVQIWSYMCRSERLEEEGWRHRRCMNWTNMAMAIDHRKSHSDRFKLQTPDQTPEMCPRGNYTPYDSLRPIKQKKWMVEMKSGSREVSIHESG